MSFIVCFSEYFVSCETCQSACNLHILTQICPNFVSCKCMFFTLYRRIRLFYYQRVLHILPFIFCFVDHIAFDFYRLVLLCRFYFCTCAPSLCCFCLDLPCRAILKPAHATSSLLFCGKCICAQFRVF